MGHLRHGKDGMQFSGGMEIKLSGQHLHTLKMGYCYQDGKNAVTILTGLILEHPYLSVRSHWRRLQWTESVMV